MITRRKRRAGEIIVKHTKRHRVQRAICPITLEPIGRSPSFTFVDEKNVSHTYKLDAITKWILLDQRGIDPSTRIQYNEMELKRIDNLNAEHYKGTKSVYKVVYGPERKMRIALEHVQFRMLQEANQNLDVVMTGLLGISKVDIDNTALSEFIIKSISSDLLTICCAGREMAADYILEEHSYIHEQETLSEEVYGILMEFCDVLLKVLQNENSSFPLTISEWFIRDSPWYKILEKSLTQPLPDFPTEEMMYSALMNPNFKEALLDEFYHY